MKPEPDLLLPGDPVSDWRRWRLAAAGSALFHVLLTVTLVSYKSTPFTPPPPERQFVRHLTPLVTPPDITQKAPNKTPVKKEIVAETIAPRAAIKAPAPAPAAAKAAPPPMSTPPPPAPTSAPPPKPIAIEPPPLQPPAPAPQQPALEASRLPPRESAPPRDRTTINLPGSSIQDAIRAVTRSGASPIGSIVGDIGSSESGAGPGLNLPPSAGQPRSSLELKSDPMGVDFRPYMLQVIAAIRRNWFAVYPEAARMGQRGQVVLQFAVAKQGLVTKVIFNGQSGAKALDQSAVAAISASNPLPPLPVEFKGDRIVLQMTFLYNMQR